MLVQSQNNNIHFTSTPINYVNLKKAGSAGEGFVKAVFSKLDPKDPLDLEAITSIKQNWKIEDAYTPFLNLVDKKISPEEYSLIKAGLNDLNNEKHILNGFCTEFLSPKQNKNSEYYAIELLNEDNLSNRIVGLRKVDIEKKLFSKSLYGHLLLTKPGLMAKNSDREIKDIGEVMIGETFKIAKKIKATKFSFISWASGFHKKLFQKAGMEESVNINGYDSFNDEFTIKKQDFDTFINYYEKEYKK